MRLAATDTQLNGWIGRGCISGRFASHDELIDPKSAGAGAAALAAAPFWSMTGALATVDVQDLAGDKGSVFQKHDRVDDVLNFSHTSDWM